MYATLYIITLAILSVLTGGIVQSACLNSLVNVYNTVLVGLVYDSASTVSIVLTTIITFTYF